MAVTMNAGFVGKVIERQYAQVVAKETVPSLYQEGVPTGWRTDLYTAKVAEQRFRFEGLSYAQAHSSSNAVTVTDGSGTSYAVPLQSQIVDGSSGSAVFERYAVEVTRGLMSPRLWWLEVVVRNAVLYCNGTQVIP